MNIIGLVNDWKMVLVVSNGNFEMVQVVIPIMKRIGELSIGTAARLGDIKVVKLLAPLMKEEYEYGRMAIFPAACEGHVDIVKYFAQLVENPNAPSAKHGETPLELAKKYGHDEIVKFLQSYI